MEYRKINKDYQVSDKGDIKTLIWKEKNLKIQIDAKWYCRIALAIDKKQTRFWVHRLVAQAFIPNPENKPCINHKNGIKHDNRVENLEWTTWSENEYHKIRVLWKKNAFQTNHHNTGKFWKDNAKSKKVKQYTDDGKYIKTWNSMADVQREIWIRQWSISSCCTWRQRHAWPFKWKFA